MIPVSSPLSIFSEERKTTTIYNIKTAHPCQVAGVHPHPYVFVLNQIFLGFSPDISSVYQIYALSPFPVLKIHQFIKTRVPTRAERIMNDVVTLVSANPSIP
jgi:hypothetical protein